ncbi:MAG: phosphotransferase [Gammaproteobacteria bacterium]
MQTGKAPVTPMNIVKADAVTPEWLTRALQQNGIDAVVDAIEIETVGTGQLGETRRFHLHYAGRPPAGAPASVVGKFPSDDRTAATTGKEMGFYRSELMFYRELAHRTAINTPAVYVAELDDGNDFVLLFEDLAPAVQGDHMAGCSVDDARLALNEAALLHAAFWNDAELERQPWLYVPAGAQGFYTTELVESSWAHFEKTYGPRMDPAVIRLCDEFVRHHAAWNAPRTAHRTFSHNDFRVDNMLFGGERVAVVDWQTSAYLGSGMDVAYFLGSAFDRDTRRAVERDLLAEYHADLLAQGVKDYGFDQLLADYRHYSFAVIVVAVAATVIVKQTERGDRLFMKMVTDGAYQALDNDAADLLGN